MEIRAPGAHDGEPIGFVGWLGMLRALDEAIGPPEDEAPAGSRGGGGGP